MKISKNLWTYTDFSVGYSMSCLLLVHRNYVQDISSFFSDCTILKTPMFPLSLPLLTLPIKCKSNYIAHLILLLSHEKNILVQVVVLKGLFITFIYKFSYI